jgi:pilus assembly protein Flp/PilA
VYTKAANVDVELFRLLSLNRNNPTFCVWLLCFCLTRQPHEVRFRTGQLRLAFRFINGLRLATDWPFSTMAKIKQKFLQFIKAEDGPTAVEYAIMLALIVMVCLTAIQVVGTNTSEMYDDIAADMNSVRSGMTN